MTSRRDALKKLLNSAMIAGSGGLVWGSMAKASQNSPVTLRPPGAIEEKKFIQACIKCGKCVEACPYDTLKLATIGETSALGTPYFEPRKVPCYLCTNYPCTEACPSGALDIEELQNESKDESVEIEIENARMGLAVIHKESCIAFGGVQCDACYRACPLLGEAIVLEKEVNEFTQKHANLKPVINSDYCTGCGICEQVCVVEKAAIFVLPIELVTGKVGDHYIRSWKENDESKLENQKIIEKDKDTDVESAIDYLNSDEELFE